MLIILILLFLMFGGFLLFALGPAFLKAEKKKQAEEAELRRLQLEKSKKENSAQ